ASCVFLCFFVALLRLALEHERRPVVRRLPAPITPDRDLRRPERRRAIEPLRPQQLPIKIRHQPRGRLVPNIPQAYQHAIRSRVHEATCHPVETLAFPLLAETRATTAQHHQLRSQPQVENLVRTHEALLSSPLPV